MAKANDCWGIEIGANALKAMRLTRKKDEVEVADFDVLPFKKVLTSPDLNVAEAIQVNLDQFLSRHQVSRSTVVVSVPGHMAFARFAKLPPVEPKRIPDIVRFEAVQQIPFPIEEVEWDYQIFAQEDNPEIEVGIFAITRERIAEVLSNYDAVGLTVDGVTLSPLAVYNGLAYDLSLDEDSDGHIFMDIGTTSTDVIIAEEGRLWLRTLPIGGNNFTDALVRSFKLSFPKAEKLKREAGTSKYARQIFQAMRPVFADLVQEMQRSLGFYQSLNRDARLNKLIGVGSTFRLPGMAKFLKQQLQMDIIRPDHLQGVQIDTKLAADYAEHALNMATAYGLAIQGLNLGQVDANIMPRDILKGRVWRAKQPWVGAAAAIMVAATGVAWGRLSMDKSAYDNSVIGAAQDIKQAIAQTEDLISKFNTVQTGADPRKKIDHLRRVLTNRDLWPLILEDINAASLALEPQAELLTGKYEDTRKIRRSERKQVFIDSLTTQYLYKLMAPLTIWGGGGGVKMGGGSSDGVGGGGGGGMRPRGGAGGVAPGMMGGPGGVMPGGSGGPGGVMPGGAGMGMGTARGSAMAKGPDQPTFQITVQGTTPYHPGTAQLLNTKYIQWLKDNAQREGRPYRIVPDSVELVRYIPVNNDVGSMQTGAGAAGGARGGGRGGAVPGRGMAPGGRGGGMTPRRPGAARGGGMMPRGRGGAVNAPGMGGMMGGMVGGASGEQARENGLAYLPKRPDADESTANDQFFEIRWRVELITPDADDKNSQDEKSSKKGRR